MIKICTSIEQSKKLLSLGIDPSTADMMYQEYETVKGDDYDYDYKLQPFYSEELDGIPAWSLTVLSELMPDSDLCKHYDNAIDAAVDMVTLLLEQGYIKVNK